jgi:flavodoxin
MKKLILSLAAMAAATTISAQKMLVLYYSETGTTKTVAQELQKQLGADIESIECEKPYPGNFQETMQR